MLAAARNFECSAITEMAYPEKQSSPWFRSITQEVNRERLASRVFSPSPPSPNFIGYPDFLADETPIGELPLALQHAYQAACWRGPRGHTLHVALSIFNDVIIREAVRLGLLVIDLRLICSEAEDYSKVSPIEPSAKGGEKIAKAIASLVESSECFLRDGQTRIISGMGQRH